jgi:hypothetical protein
MTAGDQPLTDAQTRSLAADLRGVRRGDAGRSGNGLRPLDLRLSDGVDPALGRALDEGAPSTVEAFSRYIGDMATMNRLAGTDWLSRVTIRNTLANPLYERFCRLALLRRLLDENCPIDSIRVDSKGMRRAVASALGGRAVRITLDRRPIGSTVLVGTGLRLLKSLYRLVACLVCARLLARPKAGRASQRPLTLIDTYVMPRILTEDGRYLGRYWGPIWDAMTPAEASATAYLPILLQMRTPSQYIAAFRAMRRSLTRFIIREDLLRLSDYVAAVVASCRIPFRPRRSPLFLGFDVASLLREEALAELGSHDLVDGVLKIRHFARMKEAGIPLHLVLDWCEAQSIDRALALGLRGAYPATPLVGYCGVIVAEDELMVRPADYEGRAGILPDSLAVRGAALVERARDFFPGYSVEIAPALRYQHVWRERQRRLNRGPFTVMIALPFDRADGFALIDLVAAAAALRPVENLRVVANWHPVHRVEDFERYAARHSTVPIDFKGGGFEERLDRCDAVVSMASGTCLEAAICGIPTIVAASPRGLSRNTVPSALPASLSAFCRTPREVADALARFAASDPKTLAELARSYRADHFAPTTRAAVRALLRL